MTRWWLALLRQQRKAQFEGLSGASVSLVLPISDALISQVAEHNLPSQIRELEIKALAGDQVAVSVRLSKPAWLPKITLKLGIDEQPRLPGTPVLVLRFLSHAALAALAGPATKFLGALPPWIQMDGDLVRVDLGQLARQFDAADALAYIQTLTVKTRKGAVVVKIEAKVGE